eukprot:12088113-Alexandrium_andersonii.AAC.1
MAGLPHMDARARPGVELVAGLPCGRAEAELADGVLLEGAEERAAQERPESLKSAQSPKELVEGNPGVGHVLGGPQRP